MKPWRSALTLLIAALIPSAASVAQTTADTVLGGWNFAQFTDPHGWTTNGQLSELSVHAGALHGRATGSDPELISPDLDIHPVAGARLQLRLRSDQGGEMSFHWAISPPGRTSGFDEKHQLGIFVPGDGQFHDYVFFPDWGTDVKIYRVRLGTMPGATVDIAKLQVIAFAPAPSPDWHALESDAKVASDGKGGVSVQSSGTVTLVTPITLADPSKAEWIGLQMRNSLSDPVHIWWTAPGCNKLQRMVITPVGDSRYHTYNINAGSTSCWSKGIDRLGLQFHAGSGVDLRWLRIGALPEGDAELFVQNLAPVSAINRTGQNFQVQCTILNRGGVSVTGAAVHVVVPQGVTIEQAPNELGTVYFGEPQKLVWTLRTNNHGDIPVTVKVDAPSVASDESTVKVAVTDPPKVAPASYVPEPKPITTPFDIGVYYYPGWGTYNSWDPIRRFPERTPVLGYYKEGDPTVIDWQIKYAVEHGINFFAVDWYWRDGQEMQGQFNEGFVTARYRKLMKYTFLFDNTVRGTIQDHAGWRTVVQYWIDRYFKSDEFYKIDGKPVIIIYSPETLRNILGGSNGAKAGLEEARGMARKAGLKGIYFMACTGSGADELHHLLAEGYDDTTAYNYHLAGAVQGDHTPYRYMVDAYISIWDHLRAAGDYILAPISGWDRRPWHEVDSVVRPGNTPEEFRRLLVAARDRMDAKGPISRRAMIVEAWNEWGEGTTIEPSLADPFTKLDVIREVFAPNAGPHIDIAPPDVGMPLIEWPAPVQGPPTWRPDFHSTSTQSSFSTPSFSVSARSYSKAVIHMSVPADASIKLYWQTEDAPGMSELRAVRFTAHAGGMQTYEVPLSQTPQWRAIITKLRLDPTLGAEVESVALEP